jgi:hypothetical protein
MMMADDDDDYDDGMMKDYEHYMYLIESIYDYDIWFGDRVTQSGTIT